MSAGRSKGLKTAKGADVVLRETADAQGKPVTGLESVDFQLAMFDRMPARPAPAAPAGASAGTSQTVAALIGRLQTSWNRGEQGLFVAMIDQMRRTSPDSYRIMFTDRNSHWAGWIADRLDRPCTVFVAVGAAHLVGRDSVQAKLAALGVHSARLN